MSMTIKKLFSVAILTFGLMFFVNHEAKATEGTIDLVGDNVECLTMSVETYSNQFSILMRCENLVYPPSNTGILYYAWIENLDNGKILRVGDLDYGRAVYKVNAPFKKMFVTIEGKKNPNSPSDQVVMTGQVQPFQFNNVTSQQPSTITPPPSDEQVTDEDSAQQIDEQSESSTSFLAKITSFLLRAGIVVLVVVAIVGIILFVISKLR